MPRATKRSRAESPQRLRQNTLDDFISSPPRPSPPPRRRARGRARAERAKQTQKASKKRTWRGVSDDEIEFGHIERSESESTDVGGILMEPVKPDSEEERQPRPTQKKRRLHAQIDSDEDVEASSPQKVIEIVSDSDEDDAMENFVAWKSKAAKGKKKAAVARDSDEEEASPSPRKLVKGKRPDSSDEASEDSLMEELVESKTIESRFRARGKQSAYQKNLEKLKRKKKGQSVQSSSSESEAEEDEDEEDKPFPSAKPSTHSASGSISSVEDEEPDDSFIVEDDGAAAVDLPAQFSMNTFQDLIHQFKVICQLFVHVAAAKPAERHDTMEQLLEKQYFALPLKITRRKLAGMRDSFASSVWRPAFKRPLERYPHFEAVELDFSTPGCDACRLGRRISTRLARVYGSAYDRLGFEPVDDDDEGEDGDEDGARASDDSDAERQRRYAVAFGFEGRPRAEFNLGRFCCARTRVYHAFCHWEYAAFKALLDEIDALRRGASSHGYVRVAWAGGLEPPADLADADGLMDWLDQRGVVNAEWQRVKTMMEKARKLEGGRGGEDVDEDE